MELNVNKLILQRDALQGEINKIIQKIEFKVNPQIIASSQQNLKKLTTHFNNSNYRLSKLKEKYNALIKNFEDKNEEMQALDEEERSMKKSSLLLREKILSLRTKMRIMTEYSTGVTNYLSEQNDYKESLVTECDDLLKKGESSFLYSPPQELESQVVTQMVEIKNNEEQIEEINQCIHREEQNMLINILRIKEIEKLTGKAKVSTTRNASNNFYTKKNHNFFRSEEKNHRVAKYKKFNPTNALAPGDYEKYTKKNDDYRKIKKNDNINDINNVKVVSQKRNEFIPEPRTQQRIEPKREEVKQVEKEPPKPQEDENPLAWLDEGYVPKRDVGPSPEKNDGVEEEILTEREKVDPVKNIEIKANPNRRKPFGDFQF